jgi:hypothetical protein
MVFVYSINNNPAHFIMSYLMMAVGCCFDNA